MDPSNSLGILVGCDAAQEWLLPRWHAHLQKHHPELPIAFGNFGLSEEGKGWCQERGALIDAPEAPPPPSDMGQGWPYGGKRWVQRDLKRHLLKPQRPVWLRKPLLMERSPFERTLWLDLDCHVLGNLTPLFNLPLGPARFAVRKGGYPLWLETIDGQGGLSIPPYNSGVILFEKGSPLLGFWVFLQAQENGSFEGDDRLLSFAIWSSQVKVPHLHLKYNWECKWGHNPEARIYHWVSEEGKQALRLWDAFVL